MKQQPISKTCHHLPLQVRHLGQVSYESTWQAMQQYTNERGPNDPDQIWLLQHPSVFTQGQAGKAEHLIAPGDIPVVKVDRGGQVTYHGPGQLVAYLLLDVKRLGSGVRQLVTLMEEAVVDALKKAGVEAYAKADAPGVYVQIGQEEAKIASLGLRIRRGCSFHGLAFNLDMDLSPFLRINPCGYQGLRMTQLAELAPQVTPEQATQWVLDYLVAGLGYQQIEAYNRLD
ncbi:lipoyl(octanoyl) transferase [Oceanospirillum multiglobuliferum]|uniref:lipoyl(octanoyl) transferase LipB n=1 Tax=Oceanospirillum multiglobuliferum TaxID=64969 RepID=UPI0009CFE64E|nr:lipoyl(octanoyl) transferase LipB [Oceanospirillum multiglobuliferum]SJZ74301.1 lipoyl(octanoyl) transferase [Oceanospirillum multiglobuliferum]